MVFTLEVRRARKGDCLLLHFGTKAKPGLLLIDGGPKGVYGPQLKKRLERLASSRKRPLSVDAILVSHVDDDHIQGLLDLTREELDRDDSKEPKLLAVRSLWHNSFSQLAGNAIEPLRAKLRDQFGAASLAGAEDLSPAKVREIEDVIAAARPGGAAGDLEDSLKVLASLEQGDRLRSDAKRLDWELNLEFSGRSIQFDADRGPFNLREGLSVTILGPLPSEIEALRAAYEKWAREHPDPNKGPPEVIAAYLDKSVTNLSSIVLLVESDGKRMLLTGDARGDKIIEGLKAAGLIEDHGTFAVDILKVPHHGSSNNLERSFFEQVPASHYVFSGDGEHGNPERETMKMLFDARGTSPLTIHLTYPLDEIDENRAAEWEKQRNAKIKKRSKSGGENTVVPDEWSPVEQGLSEFFKQRKLGQGQQIKIVQVSADHKIDLSDPLSD